MYIFISPDQTDYEGQSELSVIFEPSETEKEVQIIIRIDNVLEALEDFTAVLTAADSGVVQIVNGTATISINDDDGTCL